MMSNTNKLVYSTQPQFLEIGTQIVPHFLKAYLLIKSLRIRYEYSNQA